MNYHKIFKRFLYFCTFLLVGYVFYQTALNYPESQVGDILGFGIRPQSESEIVATWKLCRNILYSLVAVKFILEGINVAIYKKIDFDKDSYPRYVILIIFITFSYAVGKLFSDPLSIFGH